jgi:hypothetical protein
LSYNRTYWQNHVTEYENRYTVTQNPDGTENHIPVEGEILQQGTRRTRPILITLKKACWPPMNWPPKMPG